MQKDYNEQSLDKRCMSTVQLLIDIENLAHADYMTGTLNSGIPYLIEVCACPTCIEAAMLVRLCILIFSLAMLHSLVGCHEMLRSVRHCLSMTLGEATT